MFEELIQNTSTYVQTNPWMALVVVFLAGVLTASSPCVLAMIPLMMAFVAGRTDGKVGPLAALRYSGLFILGLTITFTTMGMFASLAGRIYGDVSSVWDFVVTVVCLVMGLHLMGVLKFTIPMPIRVQPRMRGTLGALNLGLLFGVVSAPCAAPVLVVLLTYLAGSGASVPYGGLLLFVYGLGHSVLILVAGTSMGAARKLIESTRWARANVIMQKIAAVFIILVGCYFFYEAIK